MELNGIVRRFSQVPGQVLTLSVTAARVTAAAAEVVLLSRALLDEEGPLAQLSRLVDVLEQLAAATATLPQVAAGIDSIDKQVTGLAEMLDELAPALVRLNPILEQLGGTVTAMQETAQLLGASVQPLGRLAERVPGGRKRHEA